LKNVQHIAVLLIVTKGNFTQTRTCVLVAYACVTHRLFDHTSINGRRCKEWPNTFCVK